MAAAAVARGWTISGAVGGTRSRTGSPTLHSLGVAGCETVVDAPASLPGLLERADVYVGAATAGGERANLECAARAGVPAVVATTGFGSADRSWLESVARRIPLVLDPNFSLGMAWIQRRLGSHSDLPPGFDLALVEAHRRGKLDRPSGTAARWAELISAATPSTPGEAAPVEISSVRVGELPGVHTLWVAGPHELVRIEHIAFDRTAFAEGILWAAGRLAGADPPLAAGRYRLADLLAPGKGAP